MTSSVIGYFTKLVLKDKIQLSLSIGNEELIGLLEELGVHELTCEEIRMSIKAKLLLVLAIVMGFLVLNIAQEIFKSMEQKERIKETMILVTLSESLAFSFMKHKRKRNECWGF